MVEFGSIIVTGKKATLHRLGLDGLRAVFRLRSWQTRYLTER